VNIWKKAATTAGAIALASVMSTAVLAAEYEWKFQTSAQAGDNFYPIQKAWGDRVGVMSGGRIKIEILPVGAIVPYNETLDAVGANIIQGHITDPSYFAGKDPAFAMLGNLVGAYSAPLQMFRFMEYGGGKELFNELVNPYGLQFIGAAAAGVEAFVSAKPIRSVADLKGIKMRAPEGMVQEIFALAGASPVPLPGSEVYTSLEKGVIDAADYTVFSTNNALGLHKFAKYPIYPGFHSMPVMDVSMNKEIWDGLPDDLKEILSVSVRDFAFDITSRLEAQDAKAVVEVRKDPTIEIIDWPIEERVKFTTIAKNEWANWAKRSPMAQKVYDAVTVYLRSQGLLE
jgi:TRAP-type mannitol/chloroaromatic compound transport system substrate-binding protein|tara:strand:- start:2 stop:1030 length:1029 start_codon:yes stop_codon:yes gene_type:complete